MNNIMSYKENLQNDIREAYLFLRKNNTSIPDDSLLFIYKVALEKTYELI
jgi:hypothetical protein